MLYISSLSYLLTYLLTYRSIYAMLLFPTVVTVFLTGRLLCAGEYRCCGWNKSIQVITWNLAAVERHGDVVSDGVFGHKQCVEQGVAALNHLTWNVSVVDGDLNVAASRTAGVDCTRNTSVVRTRWLVA